MVADNHSLIYVYANQYHINLEEYYGVLAIGLCKAVVTYKPEMETKFSTYAFNSMYFAFDVEKRREKRLLPALSYDTLCSSVDSVGVKDDGEISYADMTRDGQKNTENEAIANVMSEQIYKKLSRRDKEIISLVKQGYTFAEIGTRLGCTKQNISLVVKRIKEKVYQVVNIGDNTEIEIKITRKRKFKEKKT